MSLVCMPVPVRGVSTWYQHLPSYFSICDHLSSTWYQHLSLHVQAPQSGGFVSAVDHSEGLKANLEEEGALLQDFHIVFTCKVEF